MSMNEELLEEKRRNPSKMKEKEKERVKMNKAFSKMKPLSSK